MLDLINFQTETLRNECGVQLWCKCGIIPQLFSTIESNYGEYKWLDPVAACNCDMVPKLHHSWVHGCDNRLVFREFLCTLIIIIFFVIKQDGDKMLVYNELDFTPSLWCTVDGPFEKGPFWMERPRKGINFPKLYGGSNPHLSLWSGKTKILRNLLVKVKTPWSQN